MRPDAEDISVVSAVYNHAATVAETIESVLTQRCRSSYHLYCINDASTDDSAAILERYRAKYPDMITVLNSKVNQGSGKKSFLHNRPPVRGKYWCLLAGDDFWTCPDKLERQVEMLSLNPRAVGCASHTVMKDERNGEESLIAPDLNRWNLMDILLSVYGLYVHPSSILWRNVHAGSGSFMPPQYVRADVTGDVALLYMMLAKGGEMVVLPSVTSCYRVTGTGVWSCLTQEEKDKRNENLVAFLSRAVPYRFKLSRMLHQTDWGRKMVGHLHLPTPVGAV
jgi:glycosyltransferase involved in cell wall biosynthesis